MKIIDEFWAVIPARSGSKSLKNKNIKKFLKLPLIAHSILSAKKNKLIKKIIFSSDSKKYISIAKKFKCDFYIMRTKKNSGDFSTDFDVFHEVILNLRKKNINLPKFFVHFRPTNPLRKNKSITKAIKIFKEKNNSYSSLKSISLNSHNSLKDYKIKNKKLFSIETKNKFNIDKVNIPREKLEKTYIGNGVVDIYKTKNILKGKLLGNKVFPFITEEIFCDIDSERDFKIGQILATKLHKE